MVTRTSNSKITKALLTAGIIAGPLYVGVGITEGLTRKGFSFTRNDLSVLANGSLGWIHMSLLIVSGLLAILGASGIRRVLSSGKGSKWVPRLLSLYGLGLIGAGIFTADPQNGFPQGTPADAHNVSWHGGLHLLCGSIGFIGLIIACLLLASRFKASGERGWAIFSRVTGLFYLFAFLGIAMGSNGSGAVLTTVILLFSAAVALGWAWISALSAKLRSSLAYIR